MDTPPMLRPPLLNRYYICVGVVGQYIPDAGLVASFAKPIAPSDMLHRAIQVGAMGAIKSRCLPHP